MTIDDDRKMMVEHGMDPDRGTGRTIKMVRSIPDDGAVTTLYMEDLRHQSILDWIWLANGDFVEIQYDPRDGGLRSRRLNGRPLCDAEWDAIQAGESPRGFHEDLVPVPSDIVRFVRAFFGVYLDPWQAALLEKDAPLHKVSVLLKTENWS